jgi:hypothetical protein
MCDLHRCCSESGSIEASQHVQTLCQTGVWRYSKALTAWAIIAALAVKILVLAAALAQLPAQQPQRHPGSSSQQRKQGGVLPIHRHLWKSVKRFDYDLLMC